MKRSVLLLSRVAKVFRHAPCLNLIVRVEGLLRPYLAAGLLLTGISVSAQIAGNSDPMITDYTIVVEQPVVDTVRISQVVAINGRNFGIQPGMLQIGCIDVMALTWSPDRITFRVPAMPATTSPVMLTVFTESPRSYYRTLAWKVSQ